MLTTDLSLRVDPAYEKISRRFLENPDQFADAFARAWFKLTHRDMGPVALPRPAGAEGRPALAGPDPGRRPSADRRAGHRRAEGEAPGLGPVGVAAGQDAWASASTFRGSDKRGGANGARIRLAPQKDWEVNQPEQLAEGAAGARRHPEQFNAAQTGGKKVSLADLIVLGGCAASRRRRGTPAMTSPCPSRPAAPTPRRSRPTSNPSRCSSRRRTASATTCGPAHRSSAEALVDKAQLLTLTAPEMTVLVGGLRALGANTGGPARRLHRPAGHADERLLRQPARHGHHERARCYGLRCPDEAASAMA
jgi:catalase-peroxidase